MIRISNCAATLMTYLEGGNCDLKRDKDSRLHVRAPQKRYSVQYSNTNVPVYLHFVSLKFCIANQKVQQGKFSKNAHPIVDITGNPSKSTIKTEHELTPLEYAPS